MVRQSAKSPTTPKRQVTKPTPAAPRKVGRPRAKHSSPDYTQMSIYIHRDVRTRVKMRLLETDGEFSGLVEELLRDWLKKEV